MLGSARMSAYSGTRAGKIITKHPNNPTTPVSSQRPIFNAIYKQHSGTSVEKEKAYTPGDTTYPKRILKARPNAVIIENKRY